MEDYMCTFCIHPFGRDKEKKYEKCARVIHYFVEKAKDDLPGYRLGEGVKIEEGHIKFRSLLKLYNEEDVKIEIDTGMNLVLPGFCGSLPPFISFQSKCKTSLEKELKKIGINFQSEEITEGRE